ncbi:MAG: hypothetical protein JWL68_713 [Actinomycetia bacterium]|nr:hypothetical protein [Actinomycetes bacterium]
MSEAATEALESELYEGSEGESEATGEALGEAFESEAAGEAGYGEAYWDDARRRRQRQIMMARMAQQRRPPPRPGPPRPVIRAPSPAVREVRSEIRSLDLDTKVALDALRNRLNRANRLAHRNAWAAEASVAASQVLDSFEDGLEPHDWARAIIRAAPTLILAPGEQRKRGLEGILFDPRVAGGALIAAIWGFGHFRKESKGVARVEVRFAGPLSAAAGAANTAELRVVAYDKAGDEVKADFTYAPDDTSLFNLKETAPGIVTLTGLKAGNTWLQVTADGKTGGTYVRVDP